MVEVNRLSCVRCKDRKVRCSRVMPQCDRCESQELDCVYPERQKRRTKRPVPEYPSVPDPAISTILERLQRVEDQCVTLPQPSPATAITASPRPPTAYSESSPMARQPVTVTPSPVGSNPLDEHHASLRSGTSTVTTPAAATAYAGTDATAVLKDAVDHVRMLRLQTYGATVVTEEIKIPPELAKSWIRKYFSQKPTDMFLSLLDKRFMELIPDMLSFPHVHVDSCVLVVYYAVLWYGCSMFTRQEDAAEREATGSICDLMAAIFMARLSGELFDYEMAWKMFKLAADYAHGLDMHNIDQGGGVMRGIHNPDASDDDRKAFWDLIQVDMFFRLMFNKPPSISGNAWKVNLPWLDPSSQPAPKQDTAVVFLFKSRVTLVLIRFFAMLEECADNVAQMMRRTEEMCWEIKCIYDEWNVREWAKQMEAGEMGVFTVADVALQGHTCIIFMLRKMATLDSTSPQPITTDTDVPDSPMALDAARHLVDMVGWLLAKYPTPTTLSATFGAYRAYVPFAYLAKHMLRGSPSGRDTELLDRAARSVGDVSRGERDFVPLARAVQSLNDEVRRKAGW